MIMIKNTCDEELELITHINTTVKGCRVAPPPPGPQRMKPGEEIQMLGYEPGVSYTIRPVHNIETPRTFK